MPCFKTESIFQPQDYEENKEFMETLSNHNILQFDATKEKLLYHLSFMKDFLKYHYLPDILCKIGLYPKSGICTPCAIIHPAAFEFIVGCKTVAVTVHNMKDEMKDDIAKILGINSSLFRNTTFTLIKANNKGYYNPIDLIHEATHIVQPKSDEPTLVDEVDALINEILIFKLVKSDDFIKYISGKMNKKGQIDVNIMKITKYIWDLTQEKGFWDVKKSDKIRWTKQFIQNNPLKNIVN